MTQFGRADFGAEMSPDIYSCTPQTKAARAAELRALASGESPRRGRSTGASDRTLLTPCDPPGQHDLAQGHLSDRQRIDRAAVHLATIQLPEFETKIAQDLWRLSRVRVKCTAARLRARARATRVVLRWARRLPTVRCRVSVHGTCIA